VGAGGKSNIARDGQKGGIMAKKKLTMSSDMVRSIRITGLQSRSLSNANEQWLRDTFHNDEWDDFIYELYCRRKYHHKLTITNESVRTARKIHKELGELVFPCAERLTTPYKDAGSWGWLMYTVTKDVWGSPWSLRECSRKDRYLIQGQFNEIIPEKIGTVRTYSDKPHQL